MEHRRRPFDRATPAGLDYDRLLTTLSTRQAVSRTGTVAGALQPAPECFTPADALAAVASADAGWSMAARSLGSSFNPDAARREKEARAADGNGAWRAGKAP